MSAEPQKPQVRKFRFERNSYTTQKKILIVTREELDMGGVGMMQGRKSIHVRRNPI